MVLYVIKPLLDSWKKLTDNEKDVSLKSFIIGFMAGVLLMTLVG